MSETGKDTIRPNLLDTVRLNWPEFSRLLDDYRDAAYWAGYKDAKSEILELYAKVKNQPPDLTAGEFNGSE